MNRTTKIAMMVLGMCMICFIALFVESCHSDFPETSSAEETTKTEFRESLRNSIEYIGACSIGKSNASKTNRIITDSLPGPINDTIIPVPGKTPIFIELPGDFDKEEGNINEERLKQLLAKKSLEDLVNAADSIGAHLTLEETEWADGCVYIRNEQAHDAIKPMIQTAKNYLYAKNFSDEEIQEMLTENNAQECDLVPLVLSLVEQEKDSNNLSYNSSISFSIFAQTAYASELTLSKVATCAFHAVTGGHEVYELMHALSGAVLTKAAVKAAFKIIVKRTCGVVAVAFAIYEFSVCINE